MNEPTGDDKVRKPEGVKITESELLTLINESTSDNYLALKRGIGWVMLECVPGNRWALRRIAEMRGIDLSKKSEAA